MPPNRQPCWVCGKRGFWGARFGWLCPEHAQAAHNANPEAARWPLSTAPMRPPATPEASAPPEPLPFVASRPELTEAVDRMRDDVRAALVPHLGERMTSRPEPTDPHPAPWRWVDIGGKDDLPPGQLVGLLKAADGTGLVSFCHLSSPRVRELLRAAPEMEAMLRGAINVGEVNGQPCCPWCLASDHGPGSTCPVGALLDRIDKAGR